MKTLVSLAIDRPVFTYFFAALLAVGGIASYFTLGKLEDPDFTVKTAIIMTQYPGASPEEVEEEVTDKLEGALQEMTQLRFLTSYSRAGSSLIKVEIQPEYWADRLPQVWDEMRKKVNDVSDTLPPGVAKPMVMDDFSFVYGFVIAVTGDGYNYAELEEQVKNIRKELNLVPGVARVELWGQQPKVIYIDVKEQQLAELGLTTEALLMNLTSQNIVVDPGAIDIQNKRIRFEVTGDFTSVEQIENLTVRASLLDNSINVGEQLTGQSLVSKGTDLLRVKDVATVRRGYLEPQLTEMRFQGRPSIAISVATTAGGDITATGNAIAERLDELKEEIPVGIEIDRVAWQGDLVEQAVGGFIINLLESVLIVLVVIALGMGLRVGLIVGSGLALTILGTLIFLNILGVDLHRVSLGAFVIALGMMVDNSIVIADGISSRLKKGMNKRDAAIQATAKPAVALLGATLVAVAAFYPSIASKTDGGEYGRTMFIVVGISLMLSWVLAMTVTPLQCMAMLKVPKGGKTEDDADSSQSESGFLTMFRRILETAIRKRAITVLGLIILFVTAVLGFQKVDQAFFTDSTRTQFMIDYWAPEGTRIQNVSSDLKEIEDKLMADDRVLNISTYIGGGPPRFYLPVDPEFPYQSYAQIVVNTKDLKTVTAQVEEMTKWVRETQPQAMVRVRKFSAGPGFTWPFEARFSGPANADPEVLKDLAEQGKKILAKSAYAKDVRTDMRQPVQKAVAQYDDEKARWAVVSRVNVASALRASHDGLPVGLYREADSLQPVVVRFVDEERQRLSDSLDTLQVRPALSTKSLPLDSVTNGIKLEWEDPIRVRWNRRPAITVQAAPDGVSFPTLLSDVREEFEAIPLPPGYKLEWRGEYFGTLDSQLSLIPGIIASLVLMLFLMVALFNSVRIPALIFIVVPLGIIGIVGGLLITNNPFSFMALIGAISLSGMMIKNSIVLIDEIRANEAEGLPPYKAVVEAAVSRTMPIMLGAATTILGVAPLLQDIFWVAMSVTIMAGLTLGTLFTLIVIPVGYTIFFKIKPPAKEKA
ncbi:efflux RND transporter permease subunit [Verrucomicrobiaceae bacterium N1E253]|uniref:Efflux RND transporter permease subunit n=1 Tax=Oceaniferula marina TaxID=2748318 RepID=A0A851GQ71_9BACT|nr:efflux RND transporter permease subunit [Oceaniferula marina]NWK56970.1 efflux RND transporter permease subunit [Oceaniferula marina]